MINKLLFILNCTSIFNCFININDSCRYNVYYYYYTQFHCLHFICYAFTYCIQHVCMLSLFLIHLLGRFDDLGWACLDITNLQVKQEKDLPQLDHISRNKQRYRMCFCSANPYERIFFINFHVNSIIMIMLSTSIFFNLIKSVTSLDPPIYLIWSLFH